MLQGEEVERDLQVNLIDAPIGQRQLPPASRFAENCNVGAADCWISYGHQKWIEGRA